MLGNAAIPVFAVLSLWAIALFPLVVVVEGVIARRTLQLPWSALPGPLVAANLASCIAGVLVIHLVGWAVTSLHGPVSSEFGWLFWAFPGYRIGHSVAGLALMLGLCCWLSVWIEARLLRHWWGSLEQERIHSFARLSHLPVYGLWFVVGAAILISVPRSPY